MKYKVQKETSFQYPIGILAFNRPAYLEELLSSLTKQSLEVRGKDIYILIDGFEGSRSYERGESDLGKVAQEVCRKYFPESNVIKMQKNVGTAIGFYELRRHVYASGAEWALFIEEDIVLNPLHNYILDKMISKLEAYPQIAQISCFWPYLNQANKGRVLSNAFGTKAFAERQESFRALSNEYEQYLKVLSVQPYHNRNGDLIRREILNSGFFTFQTQQDCFVDYLLRRNSMLHVSSPFSLAKDIGFSGSNNKKGTVLVDDKQRQASQMLNYISEIESLPNVEMCALLSELQRESREAEIAQLLEVFAASESLNSLRGTMKHLIKLVSEKICLKVKTISRL